jgi:hypothetical protein
MPNRSELGGSPLGLIGLKSSPTVGGMSTFNGGDSRNVNVENYNKSRGGTLFTGKRTLRAWPEIKMINGAPDYSGNNDVDYVNKTDTYIQKTLHNDMVYDTSVLNIIEQLSNTKAQLKPADFAYLKNIGVYPNNRLMIARRFSGPVADNIMYKKKQSEMSSLATLMSWVPETQDFLSIDFGESWTEADADFTGLLNSLGKDVSANGSGGGFGGNMGSSLNAIPLPGFTEIFQRKLLEKLGLFDEGAGDNIPAGNPNLIKEAKQRKTVGYGSAGSGLTCNVNIKMTCEYELKYISGIDPTIVWMDLVGTIVRFGTSESTNYGLGKTASQKVIGWANNPNTLVTDFVLGMKKAIAGIIDSFSDLFSQSQTSEEPSESESKNFLAKIANKAAYGLVLKYRVKLIGIINALSGLPSTPWHITIGNPLRPTFCSGDMLTQSVTLKLGPTLAFNDLPISITADFNLTNARPWGLQEIMSKFNSGYLRTVDVQKSYYETKKGGLDEMAFLPLETISPVNSGTQSSVASSTSQSSQINTGAQTQSTEDQSRSSGGSFDNVGQINSDANSTSPTV